MRRFLMIASTLLVATALAAQTKLQDAPGWFCAGPPVTLGNASLVEQSVWVHANSTTIWVMFENHSDNEANLASVSLQSAPNGVAMTNGGGPDCAQCEYDGDLGGTVRLRTVGAGERVPMIITITNFGSKSADVCLAGMDGFSDLTPYDNAIPVHVNGRR